MSLGLLVEVHLAANTCSCVVLVERWLQLVQGRFTTCAVQCENKVAGGMRSHSHSKDYFLVTSMACYRQHGSSVVALSWAMCMPGCQSMTQTSSSCAYVLQNTSSVWLLRHIISQAKAKDMECGIEL